MRDSKIRGNSNETREHASIKFYFGLVSVAISPFILVMWDYLGIISELIERLIEPLDFLGVMIFYFGVLPTFSALIYLLLCRIFLKEKIRENLVINRRDVSYVWIATFAILFLYMLYMAKKGFAAMAH